MRSDQRMNLVKRIIKRGCKVIVITGGEPFVIAELPRIIKYFASNSVIVNLSTNGNTLLKDFPDFYKYVNILALPLDSNNESTHSRLRNMETNYKNVIDILDHIKENHIKERWNLKIKIETVLCKSNEKELPQIAEILKKYDVDVWKIFEYNHYPDRPHSKNFYDNEYVDLDETKIISTIKPFLNETTELICANGDSRNNRYFMINPDGSIVLPKKSHCGFTDEVIGSLLNDTANTDNVIKQWFEEVDNKQYHEHLNFMYDSTYKLLDPVEDKVVLKNEDEILLWESISTSGLSKFYESREKFEQYRKVNGRSDLASYISLAKEKVVIMAHSLSDGLDEKLEEFLKTRLTEDQKFTFTLILPKLKSNAAKVIAESRYNPSLSSLKKEIEDTEKKIKSIQKEVNVADRLILQDTDKFFYGSIIIIDDEIIQIETKFYGVDKSDNLVYEFRKTEKGYFNAVYKGVNKILENKKNEATRNSAIARIKEWVTTKKDWQKIGAIATIIGVVVAIIGIVVAIIIGLTKVLNEIVNGMVTGT